MDFAAGHVGAERRHVKLDVRRLRAGIHPRKQATLIDADSKRATAVQQPVPSELEPPPRRTQRVIGRDRFGDPIDQPELQVVLEVLADRRPVELHRNAVTLQRVGGANSREHQKLRRLDRAGGEDHAALGGYGADRTAAAAGHADRATSGEQDLTDLGVGKNG